MSGRIYDMNGRDVTAEVQGRGLDGIFDINSVSIGAQAFEFLNPEKVQAEYAALGQPVPSKIAIMAGAASTVFNPFNAAGILKSQVESARVNVTSAGQTIDDAFASAGQSIDDALAAAGNLADNTATAGKWLIVGLVAFAVLEVMKEVRR